MTIDFYEEVVKSIESNVAGLRLSDEKMELSLTDLGVDSLDVMLVLVEIQERTGVQIPEKQADLLKTPAQIVNFLRTSAKD